MYACSSLYKTYHSFTGLAHFCEHMVFMGSEKYPDENSFDDFIQRTGGSDNAHTDCETTVFYFETQRKSFREGRDEMKEFHTGDGGCRKF